MNMPPKGGGHAEGYEQYGQTTDLHLLKHFW